MRRARVRVAKAQMGAREVPVQVLRHELCRLFVPAGLLLPTLPALPQAMQPEAAAELLRRCRLILPLQLVSRATLERQVLFRSNGLYLGGSSAGPVQSTEYRESLQHKMCRYEDTEAIYNQTDTYPASISRAGGALKLPEASTGPPFVLLCKLLAGLDSLKTDWNLCRARLACRRERKVGPSCCLTGRGCLGDSLAGPSPHCWVVCC